MNKCNTGAGTNPEDYELAACIAAIYAYQALSDGEAVITEKKENAWGAHARLESCGLLPAPSARFPKRRLWQFSGRCLFACLAFCSSFFTGEVKAQETQFPAEAPSFFRPASQLPIRRQSENSPFRLKIGLNLNATTCNITLPDGAEVIDEASSELLAELPPQSLWQISCGSNTASSGKKICFSGQIGNLGTSRVLLAKTPGVYQEAEYSTYEEKNGINSGFKKQPYVLDEIYPKFSFNTAGNDNNSYAGQFYRPIGYIPDFQPAPKTGYIIKPLNPEGVFGLDGKTYRGQLLIEIQNNGKSCSAINLVDIEDYLLSVVPSEMPSSWGLEALKAQAIAARSYALANLGKHRKDGYDLKASTEDQVYTGVQAEVDATNTAVSETTGLVIKHESKPISAFFHSAAGGFTETAENVWSAELPYLKSVPDFDDQSPHFNWNRSFSFSDVESRLSKSGFDIGGILGLFPLSRAGSQRVKSVLVSGSLRSVVVSGEDMRRIFTLPSTVFNIAPAENGYILAGRGFGHGLGLSQWGARYLAENGYNAAQIISYYYKDVSVEPF